MVNIFTKKYTEVVVWWGSMGVYSWLQLLHSTACSRKRAAYFSLPWD